MLVMIFGLSQKTLNNLDGGHHGVWQGDVEVLDLSLDLAVVTDFGAHLVGASLTHRGAALHVTGLGFAHGLVGL